MNPEAKRLPTREITSYCVGAIDSNVIYTLVATYLMLFYKDHYGLKATAVALLVLVVRIMDGIIDVAVGIIVDNMRSRWGKFRPYILFGGFLVNLSAGVRLSIRRQKPRGEQKLRVGTAS
ncbi:MAG: MFS transporter [Luteolibacter sp.]